MTRESRSSHNNEITAMQTDKRHSVRSKSHSNNQTITAPTVYMSYENKIAYSYETPLQLDAGFTVTSVTIRLYGADGSPLPDITLAVDHLIRRGQKYAIFAQCDAAAIAAPETFSFLESSSMGFESASLAGEGLIRKSGDSYTYSYFLKDHLGSTRMVLDEDGGIKEALMYQPYGTVSDVEGISAPVPDPLREKFTGKEYDEDGDGNGASGIQAYHFGFRVYDPEVGIWNRPDPMGQYWNSNTYCGLDPINRIDPLGLIDVTADWGANIKGNPDKKPKIPEEQNVDNEDPDDPVYPGPDTYFDQIRLNFPYDLSRNTGDFNGPIYGRSIKRNSTNSAWDINGDGKLQKKEADRKWVNSGGDITVDNSNINWSGLKIPKNTPAGVTYSISTTDAFRLLKWKTASTYVAHLFMWLDRTRLMFWINYIIINSDEIIHGKISLEILRLY